MNRCRHDILNDMLRELVIEPRKITELCAAGNVPVDRGKGIVKDLEKFGLLLKTEGIEGIEYKLTDRGYEWIGLYKLLKKTLP